MRVHCHLGRTICVLQVNRFYSERKKASQFWVLGSPKRATNRRVGTCAGLSSKDIIVGVVNTCVGPPSFRSPLTPYQDCERGWRYGMGSKEHYDTHPRSRSVRQLGGESDCSRIHGAFSGRRRNSERDLPDFDDHQTSQILDQLIDFLAQLHMHEWSAIGGLNVKDDGDIVVGQVMDETFWQVPDIEKLWLEGEIVATLNIEGPYSTYVNYISAQIRKYIHLIQIHEKLVFMRDTIPRLEAFLSALPKHSDELNNVKPRLAHKDLHFANMLYEITSNNITAILDWEFSSVVPFTKWNPRRSFLWNGQDDEESGNEKQRLLELFTQRCKERGIHTLEDAAYSSPLQKSMQKVADFLQAIVEVAPRDQRNDPVLNWRATVPENIAHFDS
jgi:hypothetical protein